MFNGGASPSLADIAAVTGNNRDNNGMMDGMGMMGGFGAWWVLILLFALFGWGRNGNGWGNNDNGNGGATTVVTVPTPMMGGYYGGFGGGAMGFTDAAIQRGFDNQTVIQKLDGLNSGLCSLGYDQLAQMNGINTNIMQTGFGLQQGLNAVNVAAMQNANALSTQLASCCCENRQGQADIKYAMATDTCAITTAIRQAAQDIMQNDNANYRQLHDENVAIQMEQKNSRIQEQAARIQQLELQASQATQNNYLIDTLRPCPQPAYITCNPFTGTINPYGNGNCNSNCGGCNNSNF